jgi:dihydroflavonol-4-reductase
VKRAVEGISEIYHLAGKVSRERKDGRQMYDVHVEGTRLLCDAARAAGTKTIVLASTSGTIAVTEEGDVVPDETYPQPLEIISRWPYYASKAYQEMAALERFSGKGLRLVIMNPSLLLGPGDDRLSSTKLVLDFMARKISAVPTGGLSFVDRARRRQNLPQCDEEGPARRTLPAGCGKLDLFEVLRPFGTADKVSRPGLRCPRA